MYVSIAIQIQIQILNRPAVNRKETGNTERRLKRESEAEREAEREAGWPAGR